MKWMIGLSSVTDRIFSKYRRLTWFATASLCVTMLNACQTPQHLSSRQQTIAKGLEARGMECLLQGNPDTVLLRVPDSILVDYDIIVRLHKDRIVIGNRTGKNILAFSNEGRFIRMIGKTGGGPGEFQRLDCLDIDEDGRVYAYDGMLKRLTVFDEMGRIVTIAKIDAGTDASYIREMLVGPSRIIYFHHAPTSALDAFVSTWSLDGTLLKLLCPARDRSHGAYYYRGLIGGGITISRGGTLFESNQYSFKINKIIVDGHMSSFGEKPDGYRPLPQVNFISTIEQFEKLMASTSRCYGMTLLTSSGVMLRELMPQGVIGTNKGPLYQVYDTSGVYLGTVHETKHFVDEDAGTVVQLYAKFGSPRYGSHDYLVPYDLILHKEAQY